MNEISLRLISLAVIGSIATMGCFGGGNFPVVVDRDAMSFHFAPDHHIVVEHTVPLPGVTAGEAFHLVEYMPAFYRQTSRDHSAFVLADGTDRVALGSEIDCREGRGGQFVMHRYKVTRFDRDRYVRMVSDPSTSKVGGFTVPIGVVTEYIIAAQAEPATFTTRVTIAWGNGFTKSLAIGPYDSDEIWAAHVREETEGALAVIRSPEFQSHRRRFLLAAPNVESPSYVALDPARVR